MNAIDRKTLLTRGAALPLLGLVGSRALWDTLTDSAAAAISGGSLVFPTTTFTTKAKSVTTSSGTTKITYRSTTVPYVAKPVDATYQSLTVAVPVTIDGRKVDAASAPILIDIPVGGYMSSAVGGSTSSDASSGGAPSGGVALSGGGVPSGAGDSGSNGDRALAAGFVVVTPGVRGRDNITSAGRYYGKAPAAIVDLKAAVRYLHHNQGRVPGNVNRIITTGTSAGGALAILLAASAGSTRYDTYLDELGAAEASDAVFAGSGFSPITDLDHADMAYEWAFGAVPTSSGTVDQTLSKQLKAAYATYLTSLHLDGMNGFGMLTGANLDQYLLQTFLQPAATTYLKALSGSARSSYLSSNRWITWKNDKATFTFTAFAAHAGRSKSLPAFDSFTLDTAENIEFGTTKTNARHFTQFSLRHTSSDPKATIADDLPAKLELMNPMHFIAQKNPGRAKHWFLRTGTKDTDTAPTIIANLATGLHGLGDQVDATMYWDAGHGANEDPDAFIIWIRTTTGYRS